MAFQDGSKQEQNCNCKKKKIYEKIHKEEEVVQKSYEVCEILKLKQKSNIGKWQFGTTDADWMFLFFFPSAAEGVVE